VEEGSTRTKIELNLEKGGVPPAKGRKSTRTMRSLGIIFKKIKRAEASVGLGKGGGTVPWKEGGPPQRSEEHAW